MLVGLYSYPRSGSNWLRNVLYALVSKCYNDAYHYSRENWIEASNSLEGLMPNHPSSDPVSGKSFHVENGDMRFFKTHSPYTLHEYNGTRLDINYHIYVYRHPLDVIVSYLNYIHHRREIFSRFYDVRLLESVELARKSHYLDMFASTFIVTGNLTGGVDNAGSWWKSVNYWMHLHKEYPSSVLLFKYEDLIANPLEAFRPLQNLVGSDADLGGALDWANVMFPKNDDFFWQMRSNYYSEFLSEQTIAKFESFHGKQLRELGYEIIATSSG